MKTIIAPVDFSPVAFNAAVYAAEMAIAIDAELILFHVYSLPVSYMEVPVAFNEENFYEQMLKELDDTRQKLMEKTHGRASIHTELKMGFFYSELSELCQRVQPYAVVMGSQGTTATERLLFGGHTVYAMKNLNWPLITVPPKITFSAIRKIALAFDYHDGVEMVPVEEIKRMVNDFHAELFIINTGKEHAFGAEEVFAVRLLRQKLDDVKARNHFITTEDTDQAIMDFAERNDIDLLIVLPAHHNMVGKLIHRSHTRQFVLHARVPVMALHSPSV